MKKLILILTVMFFSIGGYSQGIDGSSYRKRAQEHLQKGNVAAAETAFAIYLNWAKENNIEFETKENTEFEKALAEFKIKQSANYRTIEFENGKYEGEYKNDCMNGQGIFTWDNGDRYVGSFMDDMMHGQGTYHYASGNRYTGEYKYGVKDGQGKFFWTNGERYEGEFRNNRMHGTGTYHYKNGDKFVGNFQNDLMNGNGMYINCDGTSFTGVWENNICIERK